MMGFRNYSICLLVLLAFGCETRQSREDEVPADGKSALDGPMWRTANDGKTVAERLRRSAKDNELVWQAADPSSAPFDYRLIAKAIGSILPIPSRRDTLAMLKVKDSEEPCEFALASLVAYGDDWARWVLRSAIDADDMDLASQAARTLGRLGSTDLTIKKLLAALEHKNAKVREGAADGLRWLGADAAVAVGPLINALDDTSDDVTTAAACALGSIGPQAKTAVPALLKALKTRRNWPRAFISSLGRIGVATPEVVAALTRELDSPDGYVSITAATAMVDLKQYDIVVPFLAKTVKGKMDYIWRGSTPQFAAKLLGKCGSKAISAIPVLQAATKHEDGQISSAATEAILLIEAAVSLDSEGLSKDDAPRIPETQNGSEKAPG